MLYSCDLPASAVPRTASRAVSTLMGTRPLAFFSTELITATIDREVGRMFALSANDNQTWPTRPGQKAARNG